MHLPAIFRRVDFPMLSITELSDENRIESTGVRQCKPSFTGAWFQWCPIDVIIWAIISIAIAGLAWKLYSMKRAQTPAINRTKNRKPGMIKKNGYYRLSFPHPGNGQSSTEDLSPPYAEKNKYSRDLEFSVPTDPYHVVSTLDDSLIAKDEHFQHAKMPEPVLCDKRAEKPSALGFSPERNFGTSSTIIPGAGTATLGEGHEDMEADLRSEQVGAFVNPYMAPHPKATPPPVYIPNPRLDTI